MPVGRPGIKPKLSIDDFAGAKTTSEDVKIAVSDLSRQYQKERELCAQNFWYFAQFLETYDEENQSYRTFPTYPYLHDVHKSVEAQQKNIFLKGRRLVMSWYFMARFLWKAKFAGTGVAGAPEVWQGGVFSSVEDKAIELMNRPASLHDRLPDWLRIWNPISVRNQLYLEFEKGGRIKGFPSQKEGPRTYGFSEAFFDEMAFHEFVRGVWKGLIPSLGGRGKLNAVSTPNGKFNLFADIWFNKHQRYTDVNRVKLEWWLHPEHDENWRNALASGLTEAEVAQELDLSFAIPQGDAVYPEAQRKIHVLSERPEVFGGKPVFDCWDLGYHFPAWTLWQRNSHDQWVGIRELQGYDMDFWDFCVEVKTIIETLYDRKKCPEMFCLPHDCMQPYKTRGQSGARNDLQVIREVFDLRPHQTRFGPNEVGTRNNEGPRLKETRSLLRRRKLSNGKYDGEPGVLWWEGMEIFTDAMLGGYCYPETQGQHGRSSEQPAENEYTHLVDSWQMGVTVYNRMVNPDIMLQEQVATQMRQPIIHDRIGRTAPRSVLNFRRKR